MGLIAGGCHNSEIAEALAISVLTVRKHRQNLMAKLALRNGAEIASFAIQHGLVKPRP
jgi:DNA-binding NarL/FixJ family response regulator